MAETLKEYEKLPGRGMRFDGGRSFLWVSPLIGVAGRQKSSSLWLGSDHLLAVDSAGFTEEYKRFYYRDIQSIIIRKTATGKALNWIFLALAIFPFVGVVAMTVDMVQQKGRNDDVIWLGIWAAVAFVFLLFFLINWLRGPTCATHLKTAVQLEELVSLRRMRNAEKALGLLRNRIQEAQGTLAPEEAKAQAESFMQNAPQSQSTFNNPVWQANAEQLTRSYVGRSHEIAYALVLMGGLLTLAQIFLNSVAVVVLSALLTLAASAMIVTALIRQYQTDLTSFLRKFTWACAAYYAVEMFINYLIPIGMSVGHPDQMQDEWLRVKRFAEIRPMENGWLLGWFAATALISIGFGVVGFLLMKNFKERQTFVVDAPPVVSANQSPPAAS